MFENQIDPKSRVEVDSQGAFLSKDFEAPTIAKEPQKKFVDRNSIDHFFGYSKSGNEKVDLFVLNAQVLIKHREYGLASRLLQQASNIDSKNCRTLSLLAYCLEKMGKLEEALIVSRNLIKVDYGFDTVGRLGSVLYKLGKDEEALEKYFEALSLLMDETPYLFEIYKNMGNIFVRKGDFEAAEEFYNKAYTIDTTSDVLLVNLGTLEVQRNDYNKALYCYRKAVEINITNDKAWVGLAMVHNHLGDSELAWANIEKALDTNPINRTAVHLSANWAVRDGRIVQAIEFLQNYLGSIEQDEEMSMVLANLFCMTGQYEKSLIELERILLWNPNHSEVRAVQKKIKSIVKVV